MTLASLQNARAQSYNIDFGDNGSTCSVAPPPSSYYAAAPPAAAGVWNLVSIITGAVTHALVDLGGSLRQPDAAEVQVGATHLGVACGTLCSNPAWTSQDENLYRDRVQVDDVNAVKITLSNLQSGSYDVYVYGFSLINSKLKVEVSPKTGNRYSGVIGGSCPTTRHELGLTYLVFPVTLAIGQDLELELVKHSGSGHAGINGIQLVKLDGLDATNYCQVNPNSTGSPAIMTGSGTSSITDNNLVLTGYPMPMGQIAFLQIEDMPQEITYLAGYDCVGGAGSVGALYPQMSTGNAGIAMQVIDNTQLPGILGSVLAGETWYFQFKFLDIGGANSSDGMAVLFRP